MAKKRTAKVANPRAIPASRGPGLQEAELPAAPRSFRLPIRFRDAAGWALIFCATLLAYLPALRGGLLWDDSAHVTRPDLRSFHGLWRIWFDLGATQQYYPLLHSAFWLEHRLWGDATLGYHLTNIALHALSAYLVVLIAQRLKLPGAWLAGFVFALHPVFVEGVAWISEQKDTLSGVFCLAALLAYLHFDEDRRRSAWLLATGLFVLALLSKTVTATLPAALLVILWWQRGRLSWQRDGVPLAPWLGLGVAAGLFTAWAERTLIGAQGAAFTLTPAQRLLIAGRAICFYAGKLLWPVNLTFSYPHWKIDPAVWWQDLFPAGVIALGIGLVVLSRRYRGPLASFLLFAGTLFPVLGFLNVYPFRYAWVADHFQYLASLGIVVPLAALLTMMAERMAPDKKVTAALAAVLVLLLGGLTWRQSGMYRDMETLYRETLARNPESYLAHDNLGQVLSEKGHSQDAIAEFETALRIEPDYPEAHNDLGAALLHVPGRLQDAVTQIQTSLQIDPNNAEEHYNLGIALAQMTGRMPDAVAEYQKALRIKPDYAEVHNNLGIALLRTPGRLNDAAAEFQTALRLKPDYAEAHNNLGSALSHMPGRMPDAIAEYEAALRIDPGNAEAHNNLGNALSRIPGRLPDAIAEYQAALRIRPGLAQLHYNLGLVLAQTPGRLQEAIAEYRAALRINPDYADAHFSLASALTHIPGHLQDAIAELQAVLLITPDSESARQAIEQLRAPQKSAHQNK